MRAIVAMLFALIVAANADAQGKNQDLIDTLQKLDVRVFAPDSAEAKLRWDSVKQMRDEVNKKDIEAWRGINTKADWEKLRDERIAKLRASLGNFPEAPKSVKVITTKKLQGEGFTVENIIYESRPGLYVTANLYVPEKATKPMPGFIIVAAHHNPKTQGELQDMGAIWARQGCLVLVPDMLGHGERRQHPFVNAKSYPGEFKVGRQDYYFRYNTALQLHLIGESLMGWMVWDLMRGVDVLYQRPNIDKSKIMVFGSVAGGGDPCAVFAALDPRVAAAAPFNFGGPQPETKFPLPDNAETSFNYMGGGGWESTRGLRLTGRDGFAPWVIVGSLAPRGLIYGHEFSWDQKRDPVWARFEKIWGFYDARDKLSFATGRGLLSGRPPEATHCNNIGAEHRKPIYPSLNKWFGIPIPEENKKRFDSSELQCWTDEARAMLKPKMVHELAREIAAKRAAGDAKAQLLPLLGIGDPMALKGEIEDIPAKQLANLGPAKVIVRYRDGKVPMVILHRAGKSKITGVVIGIAQEGKAGFLKHRAETIAELLSNNIAVCLPDLRGTGEVGGDGRGRTSGGTSYSASLWMHGQTVPGVQLQELGLVINALSSMGHTSIALWGDSFAEPNDPKRVLAVPHDADKMPRQAEPMGGLVALLGGVFGGDKVKAVYVRGGLVSLESMLDSPFCYYPHDAVVPGMLRAADLNVLAAANAKRGLRMEALVDGLNRRVDQKTLAAVYGTVVTGRAERALNEEASSPAEVAAWLIAQVNR